MLWPREPGIKVGIGLIPDAPAPSGGVSERNGGAAREDENDVSRTWRVAESMAPIMKLSMPAFFTAATQLCRSSLRGAERVPQRSVKATGGHCTDTYIHCATQGGWRTLQIRTAPS